ncbi:glycoside hydrolase family 9 protein [Fibrobacter sp. UWEL]|uniref:glycoside hydrolase family 9 protein n=1 Tax=Fibrobacter sp. UWEL TaxID=1896209 RepID=UPI00091CBEFB|nr:glycoside hydrolase family 9 protein [Fibrobacter sp. UWEL]SHL23422.1 endoglucanase [Fibrobacter sp. UWEL]
MFSKFGLKQFAPLAISALAMASSAFGATAYINQIGYRANDAKEFTLADGNGTVEIVDATGTTVLTATPSAASYWDGSEQNVSLVDFSAVTTPGTYSIKMGGQEVRKDLKITDNTFEEVTKAALKWFYYQRASMALEETYAGQWKRAAGHTNSTIQKHSSAGNGSIQSSKGWYDAGDYGRYIVNSGITTYTLLSLFEHYPDYFKTFKWNIPADGTLPDLLAEIKWNLDWMLTMQDTDGGVFHKMTALGFPGDIMPAKDTDPIYVIGKGTAASLDFAGVMATASRVYKAYDANFAAQCLAAAKSAYAWGTQNSNVRFSNPSDVATGEYGDNSFGDEKLFAGTELYLATNDASYKQNVSEAGVPNWGDVSGLALYGAATYGADANSQQFLIKKADEFVARANTGFGVVMAAEDYVWGSNSVAANQGIWLLHAYYITGEKKYYDAARKALDYLLGKNPLNMSFMTGFGTKSPKKPHHRPSTADGVSAPVPGMLVGGPQNDDNSDVGGETWQCKDYTKPQPALSYVDDRCSYASNEVAINWNAPLSYLAGAIEALNNDQKPSFAVAAIGSNAIKPVVSANRPSSESVRLRFADQKVFLEKNGKRYDLKGMQIK